ncbi:MAG TPA: hypothetical protein PL072_07770 [Phycisphaerales bacterium]|nr:hypothetical protein [Phycisphaerales bacterium]
MVAPTTLLKAAAVNALNNTNVFAIARVAAHFTDVLARSDLQREGAGLVERLAAVPQGGSEKRPVRRTSLAAKFAHFVIDGDRFPIYDQYAVRMVAHHLGIARSPLEISYIEFARRFDELALSLGMTTNRRRLDRYLWVQGQFESWRKGIAETSSELRPFFERGERPLS